VEKPGPAAAAPVPLPEISDASQIDERGIAMEIRNFKDIYLAELQELASVEEQLSDALLRMAGAATHPSCGWRARPRAPP
jgi:hypothetical protein